MHALLLKCVHFPRVFHSCLLLNISDIHPFSGILYSTACIILETLPFSGVVYLLTWQLFDTFGRFLSRSGLKTIPFQGFLFMNMQYYWFWVSWPFQVSPVRSCPETCSYLTTLVHGSWKQNVNCTKHCPWLIDELPCLDPCLVYGVVVAHVGDVVLEDPLWWHHVAWQGPFDASWLHFSLLKITQTVTHIISPIVCSIL